MFFVLLFGFLITINQLNAEYVIGEKMVLNLTTTDNAYDMIYANDIPPDDVFARSIFLIFILFLIYSFFQYKMVTKKKDVLFFCFHSIRKNSPYYFSLKKFLTIFEKVKNYFYNLNVEIKICDVKSLSRFISDQNNNNLVYIVNLEDFTENDMIDIKNYKCVNVISLTDFEKIIEDEEELQSYLDDLKSHFLKNKN